MTRLTRFTMDNPAISLLLMVGLIVGGIYAAFALNQELVPDIQPPQATIVVVYPGASADEITRSVVEPIEDAMEKVRDIEVLDVSSRATDNFAMVSVLGEYGVDQDEIRDAIDAELEEVELPDGAEDPEVLLFRFSDIPVLQASFSGDVDARDLQKLLEEEVVPAVKKVEGVSQVTLTGTREDRVFLRLDPDALDARDVTLQDIRSALQANDLTLPLGTLSSAGRITPLQVSYRITDTEALGRLIVKDPAAKNGPPGPGGGAPSGPASGDAASRAAAALGPLPIPSTIVDQAAALGIRLETTDDLTPDLVRSLEIVDPALLRSAAILIADALPPGGLAILPDGVVDALPSDLRQEVIDRVGSAEIPAPPSSADDSAAGSAGVPSVRIVVVQPGETIGSIAARFGVDGALIEEENDLTPGQELEPGELLRVPLGARSGPLPPVWRLAGSEDPADVSPEILNTVIAAAPNALGELSARQLLELPSETVAALPPAFLARQDDALRQALIARRNGLPVPTELLDATIVESAPPSADDASVPRGRLDELVRLEDVAEIVIEPEEPSTINRTDLRTSLGMLVIKDGDANTVRVVRAVQDEIDQLRDDDAALGALEYNTVFEQASFIEESLGGVINEGLLGGLFAVLVILIFLFYSVRSTLVIAVSIPLSILTALLLMRLQGLSLNLITLSGLTIAIGRVVDDSIVVLENLFRNIQRGASTKDDIVIATRQVAAAITSATLVTVAVFLPLGFVGGLTREFFLPFALTTSYALLASLVVAVTLIPMLSRRLLRPDNIPADRETRLQRAYMPILRWALDHRGLTLILAALFFMVSLGLQRFIPVTFLPSFGEPSVSVEITLPPGTNLETTDAVTRLVEDVIDSDADIERFETTVGRGAEFSGMFGSASGADAAKAFIFATFRQDDGDGPFAAWFGDQADPDEVAERLRIELEELRDIDEVVERLDTTELVDDPERAEAALLARIAEDNLESEGDEERDGFVFDYVVSSAAIGGPPAGAYDLVLRGDDEGQVREATELVLAALTDPEEWEDEGFDLADGDEDDEDEDDRSFFERLFGEDEEDEDGDADAADENDEIRADELPIINLSSNLSTARQVLNVDVDPALAAARGLSPAAVAFALKPVIDGDDVGSIEIDRSDGLERIDVVAEYPEDLIDDRVALENYTLRNRDGDPVRLGDIATVELQDGAVEVTRSSGERSAQITGEILDEDTFGITDAATRIVDRVREDNRELFGDLDDEEEDQPVVVEAGVSSQEQRDGFRDLLLAVPISIGIAYLILVVEFGSLLTPLIVLLSLPFAVSGAFIALAVTQRALGISSMIGMLLLIGIVVTNAVVLLDFVKQLRDSGSSVRDSLERGGRLRVRPIMMTALATMFALIPQALGLTEGALIASELATTVIGGLVSSTLLTLVVVPVLYSLFYSRREDADGGGGAPGAPVTPGATGGGGGGLGRQGQRTGGGGPVPGAGPMAGSPGADDPSRPVFPVPPVSRPAPPALGQRDS